MCCATRPAAVEATFEQIFGKKSGKITVDPSTLSRVETTETGMTDDGGLTATTGDALLDWWNGAWYGWWKMTGCSGYLREHGGAMVGCLRRDRHWRRLYGHHHTLG